MDIPKKIRLLIYKDLRGKSSVNEQEDLDKWFFAYEHPSYPLSSRSLKTIKNRQKKFLKSQIQYKYSLVDQYKKFAAVFILFSIAISAYFLSNRDFPKSQQEKPVFYQEISAKFGERKLIKLNDGTQVKLFGPTSLFIHEDYPILREIKLVGEAFFDVRHDSLSPFFIDAGKFKIKVLGTSFLVQADSSQTSSVSIKSGIVNVSNEHDYSENLFKNEQIVFEKTEPLPLKRKIDPEISFAKVENILWYENTRLDFVLEDLKKWYGLEKLEQIGPIHEFKITGKYRNQTLKEILQSISYSTGIAYELNDKQLKITTK
ncbi:FecR family protein [Cecembia calidifontis]|uniref:FecR family protein n=1 Tax=Cecembia calidifontis TaxID=1187080 RepID=A0A4Q7PD50_9BACT|nr:FecR family protein [Cecembia calidifontis]RZS98286.1 FecR family protein [Cecembia calidifontis]